MDDKDLVKGPIGSVGAYDVAFKGGKLVLSLSESDALGDTVVSRSISAKAVLEALKKAIPGTLDDQIFNLIEAGLGL